jgi:SAM-dependent methyltransferase
LALVKAIRSLEKAATDWTSLHAQEHDVRETLRNGKELERRIAKARAVLEQSLEELRGENRGLARELIEELHPNSGPAKHEIRAIEDGVLRKSMLEALVGEREEAVLNLIRSGTVHWDAPLGKKLGKLAGMDERVVELPLAWEVLAPDTPGRALDAGCALNLGYLKDELRGSAVSVTHFTQSGDQETPWFDGGRSSYVFGDLRSLPFKRGHFDRVLCISTLEHVGMDNTRYGAEAENDPASYAAAVNELFRVTAPGGTLLVTFPYGVERAHGWFQVFGRKHLAKVRSRFKSAEVDVRYFRYDETWSDATQEEAEAAWKKVPDESVRAVAALRVRKPPG